MCERARTCGISISIDINEHVAWLNKDLKTPRKRSKKQKCILIERSFGSTPTQNHYESKLKSLPGTKSNNCFLMSDSEVGIVNYRPLPCLGPCCLDNDKWQNAVPPQSACIWEIHGWMEILEIQQELGWLCGRRLNSKFLFSWRFQVGYPTKQVTRWKTRRQEECRYQNRAARRENKTIVLCIEL